MIFYQKINSSVPYNFNAFEYENYSFIPHLHRDFELIYVKSGEILLYVEDEKYLLKSGDFGVVLQNEVHSFETITSSRIWVGVFSEEYVRSFSEEIKKRNIDSRILYLSEMDRNFLLEHLIFGDRDRLTLTASLSFLCAEFYKKCTSVLTENSELKNRKTIIHNILTFISENYTEDIKLSDLASTLGYEEHYISRLFNSIFKKRFTVLVNEYRVFHARRMILENKDKTLSEIALASGFGSVRNFNRVYKMVMGVSPKEDNY